MAALMRPMPLALLTLAEILLPPGAFAAAWAAAWLNTDYWTALEMMLLYICCWRDCFGPAYDWLTGWPCMWAIGPALW